MQEGYSLDKFRKADREDLPPNEKQKLEKYDAILSNGYAEKLQEQLQKGEIGEARATVLSLLDSLSPSKMGYIVGPQFGGKGGYREHEQLRQKYAETKKGQLELAQQEAEAVNEDYENLKNEVKQKAEEYESAVEDLKNYVESNLK